MSIHPRSTIAALTLVAIAACGGCTELPGGAAGGQANVELVEFAISELDGNGDDVPNRGETLYLKPTFRNSGQGPTGEFKVRILVESPGSTHARGIAAEQITVASIAAGGTTAGRSNFMLGLKLDQAATPGTPVPVVLEATLPGGRVQTFAPAVVVAPIDNAFTLAGTAIAEASGLGDGQPGPGEVIYLKPRFTNTGKAKTNQLTVVAAVSGDASVYVGGDAASYISIGALPPGATSDAPSRAYLGLKLSGEAKPGATIPITYTLKDPFGNRWEVADSLSLPAR